jgi:hypothetical protein
MITQFLAINASFISIFFLLIRLAIQFLSPVADTPVCPGAINYDESVGCSISAPSEIDAYTFSGTAGDWVVIRVYSASFWPEARLARPDGTMVCDGHTVPGLLQLVCKLDTTGTHTVFVDVSVFGGTGPYTLYIQRTNSPANPVLMSYDTALSDTISPSPEMDAFSFSGTNGDRVVIRLFSDSFWPEARLARPDGTILCANHTVPGLLELSCQLDTSGTYAILVNDLASAGGPLTGPYTLYIQRTNNPANPVPIGYDETPSDTILPSPEMDAFAFSGTSGDRVVIRLFSDSFWPEARLARPDGTILCANHTVPGLLELSCQLDTSGTYAIFVNDLASAGGPLTGPYSLYIQRTNSPANPVYFAYGTTLSDTISPSPEMDAFTFNGLAGDKVVIRLNAASFWPQARLARPDGTIGCQSSTVPGLLELACQLDTNGIYAILVNDLASAGGPLTGPYTISVQRTNSFPPLVLAVTRASLPNPTGSMMVEFAVTFSGPVTGVDTSFPFNDFALTTTGITGAKVTDVIHTSSNYLVKVDTGSGNGTIRLDIVDDDSIQDMTGHPLGGNGVGNGNFNAGESFTILRNVEVTIGGALMEKYYVPENGSLRPRFAGADQGPVKVTSLDGTTPILASERFIQTYQSSKAYAEMIGYPDGQLTTEYWFPWYNNVTYSTQLRIGNMGSSGIAEIKVYAGGTLVDTLNIPAGQGARKSYAGLDNGPLHVVSTDGTTPILVSERFIQTYQSSASYSEMLGYPNNRLATEYWFPWYNNVSYSTQLRVSNMGSSGTAQIKVYAGGTLIDTLNIPAGQGARKSYAGLDNGPLHVVSTDGVTKILASERFIQTYQASASYAEMMGYPGNQLDTQYCFPWYNNTTDNGLTLSSQLRLSNMGGGTAAIKVYLAGSQIDSFSLSAGGGKRTSYPSANSGPLCVVSTDGVTKILASERFISTYLSSAAYSEMMGYPYSQMDDTWWFPWYNNISYETELRIARP